MSSLEHFSEENLNNWSIEWAHCNYKPTIENMIRNFGLTKAMEIGGGRDPLFQSEEIKKLRLDFTVNDVSQHELDLAPMFIKKACFDIGGRIEHTNTYDIIFSKMVFEHVSDVEQAYNNIRSLLNPEGICINFHPVLYAFPFLFNSLIPERLSTIVVNILQDGRDMDNIPKFPARYDWCYASRAQRERILKIGFAEVVIVPFWGHSYFFKFPPLQKGVDFVSRFFANRNNLTFASYAYTIVRK